MKKTQKYLMLFLSLTLILSSLFISAPSVNAQTQATPEEMELAKELEKAFKNANLKENPDGSISMDTEEIKNNLPLNLRMSLEKAQKEDQIVTPKVCPSQEACDNVGPVHNCVARNVANNVVETFSQEAWVAAWTLILAGDYINAAKKLGKMGLKATPAVVAGQLSYYIARCTFNHDYGK